MDWVHCFAHLLHLIVSASLRPMEPTISKLRSIMTLLRNSPNAGRLLNELVPFVFHLDIFSFQNLHGLQELRMQLSVSNRWNSTLVMLRLYDKQVGLVV